tara:strand:+ start:222 stop:479 length:258 start_codon:yes stop_codon:yes gene_type:complete
LYTIIPFTWVSSGPYTTLPTYTRERENVRIDEGAQIKMNRENIHRNRMTWKGVKGVPGAGFEPAKLYAEDLESTPFDRSGTPACC